VSAPRALGFEGENEVTDTAQTKGATAFDDRSQKNQTPPQGYIDPPVTSTGDATDNDAAAAETRSRSQPTDGKGNGKTGAPVAGEGEHEGATGARCG
jgi:hypothetical protein